MKLALIDTDCCIYALTGAEPSLRTRLGERQPGTVAISAIALAELGIGIAAGKLPALAALNAFVAQVPVLPFDEAAARTYAGLPFRRARFDRLMAAHALSLGAVLVTNNVDDYADIPNLAVENWTL